jgi:enoyl-CoA hydratase
VISGGEGDLWEVGPRRGEESSALPRDAIDPNKRVGGSWTQKGPWSLSQGVSRTFEVLAHMEKPVIASLKGDAYGFAANVLWGCDIIVAREDAIVCDVHLSMDSSLPWGVSAGDGAFAFLPLFLSPTKLKEWVLLGAKWTARDCFDLGMINYVFEDDAAVDAKVNEMVAEFLRRPIGPLVRTKRAANKRLVEQMNMTLQEVWLAETVDTWELPGNDWEIQLSMRPGEKSWPVEQSDKPVGLDPQHER